MRIVKIGVKVKFLLCAWLWTIIYACGC